MSEKLKNCIKILVDNYSWVIDQKYTNYMIKLKQIIWETQEWRKTFSRPS